MTSDQIAAKSGEQPTVTSHGPGPSIGSAPTGNWILWACIVLASLWWGAFATITYFSIGQLFGVYDGALITSPLGFGLGLLGLVPGLVILILGVVGRQSIRSRGANLLILKAAGQLLAPARSATEQINTLADATRESTRTIDITTSEALASMKAMHEALSAERLRAESVSYAMADNARDLTSRLADERKGLETLSKAMEAQADLMRETIPQQSAAMVAAAKAAGEEVRAADEALETRLNHLKQAGSTLAVRLTDLDAIARDAAERTDGLVQSITAIEGKLSQSDKTVERAEQSSAMAVEAASSVGKALQDAVSAALDGAREANEEIDRISRKLLEDTARSVTELRLAGLEATSGGGAKLERRPRPDNRETAEQPTLNGHQPKTVPDHKTDHTSDISEPLRPPPIRQPLPPRTAPTAGDTDLFDTTSTEPNIPPPNIHIDPAHSGPPAAGWSDIISNLESEERVHVASRVDGMDRQEIAIGLIDRLQTSGIELPTIFRPRDKKKIAAASRKSAQARRDATRNISGAEVDRVYNRIRKDDELSAIARAFVDLEQAEALQALAETSGTSRPASPRLAAFLLTDAALTAD